jgi:AbrB family looped-hinge helix DNA binding protein
MLSVKISTKYQIAVPSEARKKLGLEAGDRLDVEIEGDVIHLRRHVGAGTRLLGIGAHLADGTDPVERVRALRDEDEVRQLEREAQIARDIAEARAAALRAGRAAQPPAGTAHPAAGTSRRVAEDRSPLG